MPRASGKTTLLIKESAKTGRPIIEPNTASARYVEEQAKEMGLIIPEPISATSWSGGYYRGSNFNRIDGFLIDEVDSVLSNIFGKPIVKATYTPDKIGVTRAHDLKKDVDDFEKMLDNFEKALDRLEKSLDEKKKEKKMSKFKVGDIVRLKPVDGMDPTISDEIKKLASTNGVIVNTFHYNNNVEPTYFLKGYEGFYISESTFEDRIYSKDDIFNINVIVPDKVVEIEFYDGKEKMVCHEDDTFDIRKCCFIAIAKHLYKKEYTQEGIEYMATQLTYQKKYVKIVDKALKDYWKKEEEKEKRICEEREREKIQEHQREKRRRYKERRTQRYKEAMIDLIADSINEARTRRKRYKE